MKAIVKTQAGPGGTWMDVPDPACGPTDVVIRVDASTVCGTDIHIYKWDRWAAGRVKPPVVFGHETAGTVVEVGKLVRGVKTGDRISVETHVPCGVCRTCRTGNQHICENLKIFGVDIDGAFAEYVKVPAVCAWVNPPEMPAEYAAMQEPLGNACYTVSESNVGGRQVVVFGDGPIGIMATQLARVFGASKVIAVGMQDYRMNMLRAQRPDHVLKGDDPALIDTIRDLTDGGPEVVLEMSGSPHAIAAGLKVIRRMGTFTVFGIPSAPVSIDFAETLIFKGLKFIGINGRKMYETWYQVSGLLAAGRIDTTAILTHRMPMAALDDAMALLDPVNPRAGKIALFPSGTVPNAVGG